LTVAAASLESLDGLENLEAVDLLILVLDMEEAVLPSLADVRGEM